MRSLGSVLSRGDTCCNLCLRRSLCLLCAEWLLWGQAWNQGGQLVGLCRDQVKDAGGLGHRGSRAAGEKYMDAGVASQAG